MACIGASRAPSALRPSPASGVLTSFDVEIGQHVPAGTPLLHIDVAETAAEAAAESTENTEEA